MAKPITKAIRNLLRAEQELADEDRNESLRVVRSIVQDRIYAGRRPGTRGAWIDLATVGLDPSYGTLRPTGNGSREFIQIEAHADDQDMASEISTNVVKALDGLSADVDVDGTVVEIGSIWLVDQSESDPIKVPDSGERWEYIDDITVSVRYCRDRARVSNFG